MEQSLVDADAARGMVPNNPRVLMASVFSRVVASGMYQEAKLPQKRAAMLQEAARDVQVLEAYVDDLPDVVWPIYYFYVEAGDRVAALRVARRSLERSRSALAAYFCAIELYLQGRCAEALKCLDQQQHVDFAGDMLRAIVLTELPDGPRRALQEYEKMPDTKLKEDWAFWIPVFLGKREMGLSWERSMEKILAVEGRTSRTLQASLHLVLGVSALGSGDRAGARKHFLKGRGTRLCCQFNYFYCQMFLGRMEKDPTWPPWIPTGK
jgi:hypothetical protein